MTHRMQRRNAIVFVAACGAVAAHPAVWAQAVALDTSYAAWEALLKKHARWLPDNKQGRVDYKGFMADRAALQAVLAQWSAVTPAAFAALSRADQMAFLINAYNGFTVELILTRYPNLKSIKDIGSLIQSAWKRKFFTLLGEERHLDWIEHEQLRPRYNDWRVHAAVNCASIGCPALRPEAFTAAKLDAQMEDGMRRFMADRTRNRLAGNKLEVSQIFRWFREDFEKGHLGVNKLPDVMARYAEQLADNAADHQRIRAGGLDITHLEYDWSLNDLGR